MKRLCIYPKDVQVLTGKSLRYGRTVINKIKKEYHKEPHQLVTIPEFCLYTGFTIDSVTSHLT
jgi:hypothetical protein